jgi:membrane protease YdiL (CAAX protease family)
MLYLLDKISLAIGHTTRAVTLISFYLVTGLIALATLFALTTAPFEYSISPDDLAMADLVSLGLIILVVWRFFRRGRQSGCSRWALVKRFAFALTYTTLLCLGVLAAFFSATYLDPELTDGSLALSGGYDDLLTYSLTGLFIAVVYGATPLPSLFSGKNTNRSSDAADTNNPNVGSNYSPEPPILKPSSETEKDPE